MAFSAYPVKRKHCENPEEKPSNNIDCVMKHAVDSSNRQEQTSQPVSDSHPSKMGAPPPRDEKRGGNVRTGEGCARVLPPCVDKINHRLKWATLMIIFMSQGDRSLNGQEYEDDKTEVEQGGKLEHEALEELYFLTE